MLYVLHVLEVLAYFTCSRCLLVLRARVLGVFPMLQKIGILSLLRKILVLHKMACLKLLTCFLCLSSKFGFFCFNFNFSACRIQKQISWLSSKFKFSLLSYSNEVKTLEARSFDIFIKFYDQMEQIFNIRWNFCETQTQMEIIVDIRRREVTKLWCDS